METFWLLVVFPCVFAIEQHSSNKDQPLKLSISFDKNNLSSWNISTHLQSVGIEYLNHEVYGSGLYSQMIFGESFEEISGSVIFPNVSIQSLQNPFYYIRHCDGALYTCNISNNLTNSPINDFNWKIHIPGLNGKNGTISFESTNYPNHFITTITDNSKNTNFEANRLGIKNININTSSKNGLLLNNATFYISYNINNSQNSNNNNNIFSLYQYNISNGNPSEKYYVSLNNELKGGCSNQFKKEDIYSSDIIVIPINSTKNIQNENETTIAEWIFTTKHASQDKNSRYDNDNATLGYISCGAGRTFNSMLVSNISAMWMAEVTNKQDIGDVVFYHVINNSATAFHGNQYQRIIVKNNTNNKNIKNSKNDENSNFIHFDNVNNFGAYSTARDGKTTSPSPSRYGIANYGLNCQLGVHFVADKPYSGFIYFKSNSPNYNNGIIIVTVSIEDDLNNIILDSSDILVNSPKWQKYEFTLTPKYNISCSNNPHTLLYQCYGKFVISIYDDLNNISTANADANSTTIADADYVSLDIDYSYFTPESWNIRDDFNISGELGCPSRKDIADLFEYEGINVLRMGGTMCNLDTYRWKYFRGIREYRQPYHGYWYHESGLTQSRGYGIFEIIDLCQIINCISLITFNNNELASDMADFVEYTWGSVNTKWGDIRINQDLHPGIYNVTWIEIGNEQALTYDLLYDILNITQIMDNKVEEMNLNASINVLNGYTIPMFKYSIGHNLKQEELNNNNTLIIVKDFIKSLLYLGDRISWDFHVQGNPSDLAIWEPFIINFQSILNEYQSEMKFVILEENHCCNHDYGLLRGLGHAMFNNMFIRHSDIGIIHGYADAIQAWQGSDIVGRGNQGQIFIAPDKAFGQPSFWDIYIWKKTFPKFAKKLQTIVVNMIDNDAGDGRFGKNATWKLNGIVNNISNFDIAGVGSQIENKYVLYMINWGDNNIEIEIKTNDDDHDVNHDYGDNYNQEMIVWQMKGITGNDIEANSPIEPNRIVAQKNTCLANQTVVLPHNSLTAIVLQL